MVYFCVLSEAFQSQWNFGLWFLIYQVVYTLLDNEVPAWLRPERKPLFGLISFKLFAYCRLGSLQTAGSLAKCCGFVSWTRSCHNSAVSAGTVQLLLLYRVIFYNSLYQSCRICLLWCLWCICLSASESGCCVSGKNLIMSRTDVLFPNYVLLVNAFSYWVRPITSGFVVVLSRWRKSIRHHYMISKSIPKVCKNR